MFVRPGALKTYQIQGYTKIVRARSDEHIIATPGKANRLYGHTCDVQPDCARKLTVSRFETTGGCERNPPAPSFRSGKDDDVVTIRAEHRGRYRHWR